MSYKENRIKEYIEKGITVDALIIALWEKLIEQDPSAADALQVLRQQVKDNNPKPE